MALLTTNISSHNRSRNTNTTANMSFLKRFSSSRKSNPSSTNASNLFASKSPLRQTMQSTTQSYSDAPPAYSATSRVPSKQHSIQHSTAADSPYAFLGQFDTIFVIDDSSSMMGRSWRETAAALSAITPICTEQDMDGIDIYFLNHRNPYASDSLGAYTNVTTTASVSEIFNNVRPFGGTPTGTRLNAILKSYLADLPRDLEAQARGQETSVKPLNIIVITDGVATDDVESAIVSAAKKLDKMGAEPWQVGIQFFQVGQAAEAAQDLKELDDALSGEHGVRDMVDTVPWSGVDSAVLTAEGIMKVTMGAINRKLDRKRGSDERFRRSQ